MVVETKEREHLSVRSAMKEFEINDHKIIERWERIYLEEGSEVAVFTSGLCPQHPFYVPKAQRFYFPIGEINVDIWQRYSTPKTLGVL